MAADALAALGIAKSLVIHLDRSVGREVPLLKEASKQGVSLTLLRASDGREDLRFRSRLFPSRHPDATCADVVGAIFDSHRRAWEEAANADGHVLVLEDDVALPGNFTRILSRYMNDLPPTFDLAMLGTSCAAAQVSLHPGSRLLLRPDPADPSAQQLLGFWAYIVSRRGAEKLLREYNAVRNDLKGGHGPRRVFTPVDLFVSHSLAKIETYVFKPPAPLAKQLAMHPSPTIDTHTPLGIITHRRGLESTNAPMKRDDETALHDRAKDRMGELFNADRFAEALTLADETIGRTRTYPCWHAAMLLQNTGLTLLRVLNLDEQRIHPSWASSALWHAYEAFSGAIRFAEGTWMEGDRRRQFGRPGSGWIGHALGVRHSLGLPPIPKFSDSIVPLPNGLSMQAESMNIHEPELSPVELEETPSKTPTATMASPTEDHDEPRFDANGPGTFSVTVDGRTIREG